MRLACIDPQRINQARLKAGMTQADVAYRLRERGHKANERSIRRWESGQHAPHANIVPALASALGVEIEALYQQDGGADDDEDEEEASLRRIAHRMIDVGLTQLIDRGEKDPLTIARKIQEQNDKQWRLQQLDAYFEEIVSGMARQRLSGQRRDAVAALDPRGNVVAQGELKLKSFWVPDSGWVRAGDLTAAMLERRSSWNRRLAFGVTAHAQWCDDVAALMKAEGAATLGKLKAALPVLERPEELAA